MPEVKSNIPQIKPFNKRGWLLDLLSIALVSTALYLGFAALRPLANPDEGRYSEIPYEMVQSGDWVTPRLNGVQYFYKPPMFYWMQAASIKTFGVNLVSLRAANSLMAVFTILFTYVAARILYNSRRTGLFSAAVLGTSVIFFAMGQIITLDMTLSAFLAAALFSIILGFEANSKNVRGLWFFCAFIFMALALLTKGLIGVVIPAAIVFLYWILTGFARPFKKMALSDFAWCFAGILVFAAIAVPWHVLASGANPALEGAEGLLSKNPQGQGFFWYYFIHEHFLRYIDVETSMRAQPWYFFIICILAGFLPWTLVLWQSVASAASGGWRNMRGCNGKALFLCVWAVFILLFFSISKSKLVPYIVPVFPALAVLVGTYLTKLWKEPFRSPLKGTVVMYAVLGFVVSAAPMIAYNILLAKGKLEQPSQTIFWILTAELLLGSVCTLFLALKGKPRGGLLAVFATMVLFLTAFNPIGAQAQRAGTEEFSKIIKTQRQNSDIVCAFGYGNSQDLPLWLGETVTVAIGAPEEQKFGYYREEALHKSRYINTPEEFKALLNSGKRVFVVCELDNLDYLNQIAAPRGVKELARNSRMGLFMTK